MPGNRVVGEDVVLIGQDFLAGYLGVTSQCISNWYGERNLQGMPRPLYVHYKPGKTPTKVWLASQLPAWDKWHARHKEESGHHTPAGNRKPARAA
jgi:hypothetical protein